MNTFSKAKLYYQIYPLLLGILTQVSCTVEEDILRTFQEKIPEPFTTRSVTVANLSGNKFDYTDTRLTPIVTALQTIESETHFMEPFCEIFGTPLWNYAEIEEDENQICYYVPLFHPSDSSHIDAIWFFCLENDRINYMPIRREDDAIVGSGQEFLFDALSYTIFGEAGSTLAYTKHNPKTRTWVTVTTCWEVHTGGGPIPVEPRYTECTNKTTWINNLKWQITPNLPGSGSITIPGGSGGPGNIVFSSQRIFINSDFREEDWKIADKLLDEIKEDCMGNSLVAEIKSIYGDNKIKLQYTDKEEAAYNAGTNTLSIGIGNLDSDRFFHELWHAYQSSRETNSSFNNSTLNLEIEAHYAQYIYLRGKSWYNGSEYEEIYIDTKRGRATRGLKDHISRNGNLLQPENEDILMMYIDDTVVPSFRESGYSTYPYNTSRSGISNFSNLKTLTKNCS